MDYGFINHITDSQYKYLKNKIRKNYYFAHLEPILDCKLTKMEASECITTLKAVSAILDSPFTISGITYADIMAKVNEVFGRYCEIDCTKMVG